MSQYFPFVIKSCYVNPIKSCRPVKLLTKNSMAAIRMDRQFAIVDKDGEIMNLKKLPSMYNIIPKIDWENKKLTLTSPKIDKVFDLDMTLKPQKNLKANFTSTTLGKIPFETLVFENEELTKWLANVLVDESCQCAEFAKLHAPFYLAQHKVAKDTNNSFASKGDFLMIFQKDVEELLEHLKDNAKNGKMTEEEAQYYIKADASDIIDSIRPNFVVDILENQMPPVKRLDGCKCYMEEFFVGQGIIKVNSQEMFKIGNACIRCPLLNIRSPGYLRNKEPLKTLSEIRKDVRLGTLIDNLINSEDVEKILETIEPGATIIEIPLNLEK